MATSYSGSPSADAPLPGLAEELVDDAQLDGEQDRAGEHGDAVLKAGVGEDRHGHILAHLVHPDTRRAASGSPGFPYGSSVPEPASALALAASVLPATPAVGPVSTGRG